MEPVCEAYSQDLETYALTYGNGYTPEQNGAMYAPYTIQKVTELLEQAYHNNFTAVGETLAVLYQISIGAVDFEVLMPTQMTPEQAAVLEQNIMSLSTNDEELVQFFQAYLDGMNLGEQANVPAFVQLIDQLRQVLVVAINTESQTDTSDFDTDILNIEALVNATLEVLKGNQAGLETLFLVEAPIMKSFVHNPLRLIGGLLYNTAINYPEVLETSNQLQEELLEGDFGEAGATAAKGDSIVYQNVVDFTN